MKHYCMFTAGKYIERQEAMWYNIMQINDMGGVNTFGVHLNA